MYEKNSFAGRVILITGGGTGLGLAMAKSLYALGVTVLLNGRRPEILAASAAALAKESGGTVDWHAADIRDAEAVESMFAAFESRHGLVNGLINNAAGNFLCCSEDLSSNGFKAVVDIVLQGSFHCSREFGARLIAAKEKGAIVNIVTTYAETGSAFVLPSACAKAGVVAMTKSLAFEWAEFGIRVNAVAPGPFPTDGAWQRLVPDSDFEKQFLQQQPSGRFGNVDELTAAVSFLLSDLASYVSGDVMTVDGAERLKSGQFNFLMNYLSRDQLKKAFQSMRKG